MHTTHNPSSITHNPAAEKHAFSSKERDVETGLSYFGARYYSSDLSLWLCVDPNEEEIGDFFDLKGRYLGTDGHDDRNVFIVTNIRDQRITKRNNKKELTTQPSEVDVTLSTTIDVLRETCDVYERTVNNGGDREEASTFDDNGNQIRYPTGSTTVDISVTGQVSIHSHLLNFIVGDDGSKDNIQTPSVLSQDDKSAFIGYGLNIVVGKSNCNEEVYGCYREPQAVFYNSQSMEILSMDLNSVYNIVGHKR